MRRLILTALIGGLATGAFAQHNSGAVSSGEMGQAQFAALSDIVRVLREDPNTDWTRVDITGLRNHLVDMDNVTTKAKVEMQRSNGAVRFSITGEGAVEGSIQRMVFAHSPMLQRATGWRVQAEKMPSGVVMQIDADTEREMDEVAGLGFFGLLTIGAHHQHHHLMIARGNSPH